MAKGPKDPGPSEADVAQVEVAEASWTDYVQRFRPAEAALVKRAEFSAGERNRVRGEVAGDTAAAFKDLSRKTVSASGQAGHRIGSGSLLASMAGNTQTQGEVLGTGRAAATLGGRMESEREQFRVAQIGRNISSDVQTSLSQAAARQTTVALQKAALKAEAQNQRMAMASMMGGAMARKFDLFEKTTAQHINKDPLAGLFDVPRDPSSPAPAEDPYAVSNKSWITPFG